MKQTATTSNSRELAKPIDMTYGYPGELPKAGNGKDQEKLLKFFELHASGVSARKAGIEAGFSEKWAKQYSYQWIKRYRSYVDWLQAHVAQVNVEHLAIEQSDVLHQIALIGMANDFDYLVFERRGKRTVARFKGLHELTREQMVAIEVMRASDGSPKGYRFRDRDGKLFELGKSLGMFNEKVILEHRHRHLHVTTDLSKVPMAALEAFETQFEQLLLTHEESPDAQGRLPAVRGNKGQNGGSRQTAGGGQDQGGQDNQQPRRGRAPKPS